MFVVLTLMAFVLYAPAVVLPVLREHALVLVEERALRTEVQRQTAQIENARKLIDAFRGDPLVNERLAQIDLKYQREGEEIVPVPLVDGGATALATSRAAVADERGLALIPAGWPRWSREAESWARERGLIRLFLMPGVRVVLLLMAGGLLVAAFVLYPPKGSPRASKR